MAANSKIEWADRTFNLLSESYPEWLGKRSLAAKWNLAAKCDGVRSRVVVIGDVFESHPRRELFAIIDDTPNLDWLLLTKRPENIRRMWTWPTFPNPVSKHRPNVWLGTSISTQADADRNIPELLKCRDLAPVLFVSAEPLLGPIDLLAAGAMMAATCFCEIPYKTRVCRNEWCYRNSSQHGAIDWIICGLESGPNRRPMPSGAAESLQQQCKSAGVAFFMKQMEIDGKVTGEIEKFPEPLRVRQFPPAGRA